jgi:hypothetical protein
MLTPVYVPFEARKWNINSVSVSFLSVGSKQKRTMIKRDYLEGFGAVEICQETEDGFEIKITTGFSNQASKVFTLMSKINGLIGEQYPTIKSMHADEGIFHAIYVRKKEQKPLIY